MLSALLLAAAVTAASRRSASGPLRRDVGADLSAASLFERANSCSSPTQSCTNTSAVGDLCCFNAPGGLLMQTQFWDYNAAIPEPNTSWTIHGLWPDHCDGTYDAVCDDRNYNISALMAEHAPAFYQYMTKYWLDENGENESFYEHEWTKHGTCISTLKKECYSSRPKYYDGREAVDYVKRTIHLFKNLTTYDWLAAAGITPSTSETYTLAEMNAAVKAGWDSGVEAVFQCVGKNVDEIWYYFNTVGTIHNGEFIPVAPVGTTSCPATGIVYNPKGNGTGTPGGGGSSGSVPKDGGKGNLEVKHDGAQTGCLLSYGTWSTQTCATYTAHTQADGFILQTSKGYCAVSDAGALGCQGAASSASVFTFVSDGTLTYNGSTNFYASGVPSGTVQETVLTTTSDETIVIFWSQTS